MVKCFPKLNPLPNIFRCPLLTMMQPEPVVSSSPNSVGGGGSNKEESRNLAPESGCTAAATSMAVSAAVAAAVEDSQQLALSCANSAAASGSGNFIPNHPQHSQYKGRILTGLMPNAFSVKGQFKRAFRIRP